MLTALGELEGHAVQDVISESCADFPESKTRSLCGGLLCGIRTAFISRADRSTK